jgi:hypothetical protein
MSAVKMTLGQPTVVRRQLSLYRIEEETAEKLVLRARKIGPVGAGIFLTLFGLVMAGVAIALVRGRNGLGEVVIAGVLGLLLLAGGIGLLRSGLRNKDRIIFDRRAAEVRLEKTRKQDGYAIPFSEIDKFSLIFEDRSFSSKEVNVVFKLVIITKSGDEIKVDEAFAASEMTELGVKAAWFSGIPFDEHGSAELSSMNTVPEVKTWQKIPAALKSEISGQGTVYRWRVLPNSPGLIVFFSVLALIFYSMGLLGLFLIFGAVSDWAGFLERQFKRYGDVEIVVLAIVLLIFFVKTAGFFSTILFARCRLALSPAELDYEIRLFGRRVKSKSFRLPAAEITGLALKEASIKGLEVQRRNGSPLSIMLQRFSEAELMNIKKQFLRDLGRVSSFGIIHNQKASKSGIGKSPHDQVGLIAKTEN